MGISLVTLLSTFLMASTVTTMWLLSQKNRTGFLIGVASQPIWILMNHLTGAYGLMPLAVILSYIYLKGYRNWNKLPEKVDGTANSPLNRLKSLMHGA